MGEPQAGGVQQQSRRRGLDLGRRVQGVAEDRVGERLEVNPQLVGAAGEGLQCDPGGAGSRVERQASPTRHARLALLCIDHAARPVRPIRGDGQFNGRPAFRVGLHPLTIIIAVMVGTTLMGGILGGILAIPLTAALRVLMFRYVWKKRNT